MRIPVFFLSLGALGACQTTTEEIPPQPTPTDGNVKGSSQCNTISYDECNKAIKYFNRGQLYKEHTEKSIIYKNPWAYYIAGCKAEFYCDYGAAYEAGVTGDTIQDALVNHKPTASTFS